MEGKERRSTRVASLPALEDVREMERKYYSTVTDGEARELDHRNMNKRRGRNYTLDLI